MDIAPLPMSAETAEKVAYWVDKEDYYRAIAQFVKSEGYTKGDLVLNATSVVGKTDVEVAQLLADAETRIRSEIDASFAEKADAAEQVVRTRIADMLRTRVAGLDFEKDEDGTIRKTNANRAMQIVADTLNELANQIGGSA